MKFGLTNEEYQQFIILLRPLQKKAKIWIFGSRARGDHQKYSDLDLVIESDQDLNSIIGQTKEDFENSSFPLKVDIINIKNLASSYKQGFEKDKILLF